MDRNNIGAVNLMVPTTSLSVRRAWIEILVLRLADMSAACRSP